MDKAKIMRQCNEIERAVNELYVKDSITRDERISLINLFGVIVEEITAQPKSNADKIRQMTDEELADVLQCQCTCCAYKLTGCMEKDCRDGAYKWLKQEASMDMSCTEGGDDEG